MAQTGIADQIRIGKGVKIAGERMRVLRNEVYLRRLPELFKRVEILEKPN